MRKLILTALLTILVSSAASAYVLLPAPQQILKRGSTFVVDPAKIAMSSLMRDNDPRVIRALNQFMPGAKFSEKPFAPEKGGVFIYAASKMDTVTEKLCKTMQCAGLDPMQFKMQEYFLGISKSGETTQILILFRFPVGEFHAVKTLKQIFDTKRLTEISVRDWPGFLGRGVLEGFYGSLWPADKRLAMIPWMADYKFNVYLYTPKDDSKLRFNWRSPLNKKEKDYIKKINDLSNENFVKYCWSLSPGMSLRFSSAKDFEIAVNKYRSVMELGVDCFTIAFDDVGPTLMPDDRRKFKTYWEGQVDFSNRLLDALVKINPAVSVAFVPNDYWGELAETSEYLRYVGKHLDVRYDIGFTGNKIIPLTVTPDDIKYYAYYVKRRPILGDNYPVTDSITTAGGRLSLGPLRGRDAELYRYTRMFAANAMPLAEASKPAFLTIADYTWNPEDYDADESWIKSCKILAGEQYFDSLLFFEKQNESSFIWPFDALELFEAARNFWMAYDKQPDYAMPAATADLRKVFERYAGIDRELEAIRNPGNSAMLDEMKLWISKLAQYGGVGKRAVALLRDKFDGKPVAAADVDALEKDWKEIEKNKAVVTKMVMFNFMNRAVAVLRDQPPPKEEKFRSIMSAD